MSDHPYDTIYWLGMKLEVPGDWSIARHSVDPKVGSLVLADRLAERLVLTWRSLDEAPEVERSVAMQRARDVHDIPDCQVADVRITGWHGYRLTTAAGDSTIHAARFDPASMRLIQARLGIEPKLGRATRVTEQLLNGVRCTPGSNQQRIRAFGLDVTAPAHLELRQLTIQPASVRLEFESAVTVAVKLRATALVHRMAMANAWYRGDPREILARESKGMSLQRFSETSVGAHIAAQAEDAASSSPMSRWIGRGRRRHATSWHCPVGDAVYYVSTTSADRAPLLPSMIRVDCCDAVCP